MKLTYNEIASLIVELNGDGKEFKGLLRQRLSWRGKAVMRRLNSIAQDEIKIFDELRQELFRKFGEEKDGTITIPPDKIVDFQPEYEELLSIEREINLDTIWTTPLTDEDFEKVDTVEFYPICHKITETK